MKVLVVVNPEMSCVDMVMGVYASEMEMFKAMGEYFNLIGPAEIKEAMDSIPLLVDEKTVKMPSLILHNVIIDCGDGSNHVLTMSSEEVAEDYVENGDWGVQPEYDTASYDIEDGVLIPLGGFDD